MKVHTWILAAVGVVSVSSVRASAPEGSPPRECPMHAAHAVDERHDQATGVAHSESVHHFKLGARGGSIQLEVTDAGNLTGRGHIRRHLAQIAADFGQGAFSTPRMIHGQTPPGVEVMQRLKALIRYRFVPNARGGRVDITTDDAEAKSAVHDYLRFQIKEHRTGDGG